MIIIKSDSEIKLMREAGKVVAYLLDEFLPEKVKAGVSTISLDRWVEEKILSYKMIPSFKGYNGYPASICTSINEQVVHGIPSNRLLNEGDIISIDLGAIYKGYHGDAARTYAIGQISEEAEKLIEITKESFFQGLNYCNPNCRLSDISHRIQTFVEGNGFSVVKELVGHGIGQQMHEEPQIPNYGKAGKGPKLSPGMALAIEPMVNIGTDEVIFLEDNWTVSTEDGMLSAHYENTVAITEGEPMVLTINT